MVPLTLLKSREPMPAMATRGTRKTMKTVTRRVPMILLDAMETRRAWVPMNPMALLPLGSAMAPGVLMNSMALLALLTPMEPLAALATRSTGVPMTAMAIMSAWRAGVSRKTRKLFTSRETMSRMALMSGTVSMIRMALMSRMAPMSGRVSMIRMALMISSDTRSCRSPRRPWRWGCPSRRSGG